MDKTNLYYIVIEGTDSCVLKANGEPIIFRPPYADYFLRDKCSKDAEEQYEKISVEEYERTFTEMIEY